MHSSGNVSQSIMHLYLCQDIHPMGGVRARPLSRAKLDFHSKVANVYSKMVVMQMILVMMVVENL